MSWVYIVDDDAPVRNALRRLVRVAGYDVEVFASAEEYLEREQVAEPACLVLDIRMPGMSGLELQRTIEGTPLDRPTVFITGHGDAADRDQALAEGAVDVLDKPVDVPSLFDAIDRALERARNLTSKPK